MATPFKHLSCVIGSLTLGGCATLDKAKSEWDALVSSDSRTVEDKQEAFAHTLPENTLIELCLAHDKEMR